MAALANGYSNGIHGHANGSRVVGTPRFSNIPQVVDISVGEGTQDEAVEVDLVDLLDDPTELCSLLENEGVQKSMWLTIALAYAKQKKVDHAIEIVQKAMVVLQRVKPDEKLSLLCCLCWLYLWKCREAPRVRPGMMSRGVGLDLVTDGTQRVSLHLKQRRKTSSSIPPPAH